MPKQVAIKDIIDAVLEGYTEAQIIYEKMSGGDWLWQAPEYFITATVAYKINDLPGRKYLTLEYGSAITIDEAGARGRGRLPKDIREKGKVDILLWWAKGVPRAIIEIKNQIYSREQYEKDIKRIKSFLKRNSHESSLQFGIFAFYESAFTGSRKTAKEKVEDKINNIYKDAKYILGDIFETKIFTTSTQDEYDRDLWKAASILIKLKST